MRILLDMSLGAVWALWLFKYFPVKCYCGYLRKQEDVLCVAPTCNISVPNIVNATFEWCNVSIVGAGNIKEKTFGGSVWQGGNATCHNDFVSVCVDCICVTQEGDWSHSFDDLVAISSINGNKPLSYLNKGSSSPWC